GLPLGHDRIAGAARRRDRRRLRRHRSQDGTGMRFSVFTASTPEWTPDEAARRLTEQGWDGVEWRITDQKDAPEPGFWAGNRSTWPFTGLEERLDEIAGLTRDAG